MKRAITVSAVALISMTVTSMAWADEAKGAVKTADTGRKEIVLKGTIKDTIYELGKDASCWLDGASCKLADVRADDRAVITYQKQGDHNIASKVRFLRNATEAIGTVHDVLREKREVTLKGVIKNSTYELSKTGTVWVDRRPATLNDIRDGDQVLVTYETRGDRLMATDVTVLKHK